MSHLFSQLILNWYHFYGRKNLPWQIKKTPYVVWISEVMLQQTQVNTVIPYFKKFIEYFPNTKSIKKASINEVLHLWSGLGYYKRAENIYKSSQIIENDYNGNFPNNFKMLIKLPGIGQSTAGAILSLSYNYYYAILDGNVKRIIHRYYAIKKDHKTTKQNKKLWKIVYQVTPLYHTGKFNQAMMDLGSLICRRFNPKCNICPLNKQCLYFKINDLKKNELCPPPKKKIEKKLYFIILQYSHFIFLEQRLKTGIWPNLFSFPEFLNKIDMITWIKKNNIQKNKIKMINPFYHHLTHLKLCIKPIYIKLHHSQKNKFDNNISMWYNLIIPQSIGLSSPIKKILNIIKCFYKKKYNKREYIIQ